MENMPEKFPAIIRDFLADLTTTFPEYEWQSLKDANTDELYQYCMTIYPERFFDILYQNDEIFLPTSEINTHFLPNVDFKSLFSLPDISNHTKQALWKYLQLILISIMGNVKNSASFGDAAGLFEGIEEGELQKKLAETIGELSNFFKGDVSEEDFEKKMEEAIPEFEKMFEQDGENSSHQFDESAMPNVDDIHNHLKSLFDGKIGALAKELAEELSGDVMDMFNDGGGEIKSTSDILKKMMKNPKQIMELVKKIGSKLDDKMKNGNISQEEIMKEAGEMMSKMKGMGNGKEFQSMMQNMMKSMGGGGKGKFDMGKMTAMMGQSAQKDKMRTKLEQRKAAAAAAEKERQESQKNYVIEPTGAGEFVFKIPDEGGQEKSMAKDDWLDEAPAPKKSGGKKKGKKGK